METTQDFEKQDAVHMENRQRALLIFGVMATASLFSSFHQVGLATVSRDVALTLGANSAALGLLSSAFSYPYALMQIPAGLLVDKAGARCTVTPFLLCAALGTALFASSSSIEGAAFSRILIGLGLSMVAVPLMKLTAIWFPPQDFGKMTALSFTIGGMGYWLATSPMAWASELFGWRTPFWAIAVIMGICAALVWLVVRDKPDEQKKDFAQRQSKVEKNSASLTKILSQITKNKQLWLLGFWYLFQGGVYFSFIGLWGGQYLMNVQGMDATSAGWVLSLAACAIMTAPLFTWFTKKQGKRRPLFVVLPLVSIMLSFALILGKNYSPTVLCLLFLIMSMASIGGAAVVFDAATALFSVSLSGTVCGFINMFPLAGGALLQQAIGVIINIQVTQGVNLSIAYTTAFSIYCAIALMALILGVNYKEASHRC